MDLTMEVSVDQFLSLMTKDTAWQLEIIPEKRRYRLAIWSQYDITPRFFETPDLLDLSNGDFRVLTAGLQDITERGEYAEPKPDATPGGGRKEATEREHPEGRSWEWKDESRDSLLQHARALGAAAHHYYRKEEG